jgi:hypothetical protein
MFVPDKLEAFSLHVMLLVDKINIGSFLCHVIPQVAR